MQSSMIRTNLRTLAALVIALPALSFSAEDKALTAITNINRQLRANPNRTQLTERAQLLKDLIIRRPAAAKSVIFAAHEAELLQPFADPGTLEAFQSGTTSTVLIADSADYTTSTHVYILDTPAGRVTAYQDSGEAPSAKCGDQIQLDGFRLGDVMAVTGSTVIRAADAQPNCTPLGEHKVAVLMLKFPTLPDLIPTPDQVKQQFFDTVGQSTATFYTENSLGAASITGDVFGPFTMDRLYTCAETTAILNKAISLADSTVDFSQYTHIHMVVPTLPGSCGWAGLASVGCNTVTSPSKGSLKIGYVWQQVSRAYLLRESTHELGHNFGLGHSRSVEFPGETLAPDRTHAIYTEYGDQFAVMGSTDAYHFAAPHKQMLKWFNDGVDFQTVTADTEFDLPPVEVQTQSIRALRVQRNLGRANEWVWIEYRQPLGQFDTKMSPTGWEGAILHYQSAETGIYSEVVDTTPRAPGQPRDSFGDIALLPGRTWQDPYSNLTIEVVSATPDALKVRVRYDKPCAAVTWPRVLPLSSAQGQLLPTVLAQPGCGYASTANNFWLATAADSSPVFTYSDNPDGSTRSGSVTIARQTLFVAQPGKRIVPTINWVSPASGTIPANSGGTTFTVNINSPGGVAAIGLVDLQIGTTATGVCHLRFDYAGRKMSLFPDTGTTLLTGNTVNNNYCSATLGAFSTVAAPATYQVTASLSLATTFTGAPDIQASAGFNGDPQPAALQKFGTLTLTPSCELGLSSRRLNLSGSSGLYGITLSASNCPWKASAADPWVTISPSSGSGNANLTLTVSANPGATVRSTTITILDEIIPVFQAGAGLPFYPSVQFNNAEILLSRTSGNARVYFSSNLPAAGIAGTSDSDWLRIAATGVDPILGPYIDYIYDGNLSSGRRVGSITISGATLYFTQAASIARPVPDYTISTLAGTSDNGDGGPATQALISTPGLMTYDSAGNLYIADSDYYRVRKITPDGTISTVAGNGFFGSANDGAVATASSLLAVNGVAVDSKGRVYISETTRLRRVESDGTLLTLASSLLLPSGIAIDGADNVYIAEALANRVRMYSSDGKLTTFAGTGTLGFTGDGGQANAARLSLPSAVAVDPSGNVLILDAGNAAVRKVSGGIISTIAGTGRSALAADNSVAAKSTLLGPAAVASDASGTVYIAESSRVRMIDSNGALQTVAGGGAARQDVGTAAKSVTLGSLAGLAVSPSGQVVYSDTSNQIVRGIDAGNAIAAVASRETWGNLGDTGPAASGTFFYPYGAALGRDGSIYVADRRDNRVRHITPGGTIDTIAGTGRYGFSGDKGPAKDALLNSPTSVAVDGDGNVYIADAFNNRIRKVDTSGIITTIAGDGTTTFKGDGGPATSAGLSSPYGLAVDNAGNIYVADTGNRRIRMIAPDGKISTIAGTGTAAFSGDGGPAKAAAINSVYALTVDAFGNLYFYDSSNARLRKISTDGTMSTIAGSGRPASGDSAYALNTALGSSGYQMSVTPTGELLVADASNNRVLEILPDGSLYVIAGTGNAGNGGDGGPAWNASLNFPTAVLTDGAGKIYIVDSHNNSVRLLQ